MSRSEIIIRLYPLIIDIDYFYLFLEIIPVKIIVLLQPLLNQSINSLLTPHPFCPIERVLVELSNFEIILIKSKIVITDPSQHQQIRLYKFHHWFGVELWLIVIAGESSDVDSMSIDVLLEIFVLMLEQLIEIILLLIVLKPLLLGLCYLLIAVIGRTVLARPSETASPNSHQSQHYYSLIIQANTKISVVVLYQSIL
jgi:hypothetical protein